MAKTDAERANINARAGLSSARTRQKALSIVQDLLVTPGHAIEAGTLESIYSAGYSRGFTAGVRDASGDA